MTEEVSIRFHYRNGDDVWQDGGQDYSLDEFAGVLPSIGDMILEPGVPQGRDRQDRKNRRLLTVVHRVFNARDLPNYVALIVDAQVPTQKQGAIC